MGPRSPAQAARTKAAAGARTRGGTRGRAKSRQGYAPCGSVVKWRAGAYVGPVSARERLGEFAAGLEALLATRDAAAFEAEWQRRALERVAWEALAAGRRAGTETLVRDLEAVDRRLLAVLERTRALLDLHLTTFRVPEVERWQHAAAAALVGARWGPAGLRTVIGDTAAPLARRYFAFLALAERHPAGAWPVFERYLVTPGAHHAFVAAAVDAARYYPGTAALLVALFERVRGDQLQRRFLGPRILESLYVLGDPAALPLFEELLVTGHTDPDPDRCEVTRALVAVRKLTGRVAASTKFADTARPEVRQALDEAEALFESERDRLDPVTLI